MRGQERRASAEVDVVQEVAPASSQALGGATSLAQAPADTPFLDQALEGSGELLELVLGALVAIAQGAPPPTDAVNALCFLMDEMPDKRAPQMVLAELRMVVTAKPRGRAEAAVRELAVERGAKDDPEAKADGFQRGFRVLWRAMAFDASASQRTKMALLIAADDTLYAAASGDVSLEDVFQSVWSGAGALIGLVEKAAKRLGDGLWARFVGGLQIADLCRSDLMNAVPTSAVAGLSDRLLRDPEAMAALTTNPKFMEAVLGFIKRVDPATPGLGPLIDTIARVNFAALPEPLRQAWAAQVSAGALVGTTPGSAYTIVNWLGEQPAPLPAPLLAWLDELALVEQTYPGFQQLYRARYKLNVEDRIKEGAKMRLDVEQLRLIWPSFGLVPSASVAENPELKRLSRGEGGDDQVNGGQSVSGPAMYVNPGVGQERKTLGGIGATVAPGLEGRLAVTHMVVHEIGHAVDNQLRVMSSHVGDAKFGGWESYSSDEAAVAAMAAELAPKAVTTDELVAWLDKSVGNTKVDQAVQRGDALAAAVSAVSTAGGDAWRTPNDAHRAGEHRYMRGNKSAWYRYDEAARARGVSNYQFKTPGEWFAEAYATYFESGDAGAAFAAIDPNTKRWIDQNVVAAGASPGGVGGAPSPAGN